MPNWVFNNLEVRADEKDVKSLEALSRFVEQASKPYEVNHRTLIFEDGETKFKQVQQTVEEPLSFWNFVRPDDSTLEEYFGDEDQSLSLEEKLQFKTNHWYDWNIRNWGCKWDASGVERTDEGAEVYYSFETPWSPPENAFRAMVKQFPELSFTLRSVEEQGWGCEYESDEGEAVLVAEWDIPESHEDSMNYKGWCYCEENDDTDYMFDDCPAMEEANASA